MDFVTKFTLIPYDKYERMKRQLRERTLEEEPLKKRKLVVEENDDIERSILDSVRKPYRAKAKRLLNLMPRVYDDDGIVLDTENIKMSDFLTDLIIPNPNVSDADRDVLKGIILEKELLSPNHEQNTKYFSTLSKPVRKNSSWIHL